MLSKNVDKMGQTGGRLQIYSREARGMTWLILGAIVAVFVAWLFMYFVIRLTWYLAGSHQDTLIDQCIIIKPEDEIFINVDH